MSSENVERERQRGHNILIHVNKSKRAYVRKASECLASYVCGSSWSKYKLVKGFHVTMEFETRLCLLEISPCGAILLYVVQS